MNTITFQKIKVKQDHVEDSTPCNKRRGGRVQLKYENSKQTVQSVEARLVWCAVLSSEITHEKNHKGSLKSKEDI